MPASTSTFECLLEIENDTNEPLHIIQGDIMMLVDTRDRLSLVLSAGSTYHYVVKQRSNATRITVKPWKDLHFKASSILNKTLEELTPRASIGSSRQNDTPG
ncbi:hypothetical protein PM082_002866 [Marasmius tenuissimus]|nr:hypothetical protein PM082_002866 [Marasmius tenuissimus]